MKNLISKVSKIGVDPITGNIKYKVEYSNGNSATAYYAGTPQAFEKYRQNLLFMYDREIKCK